MEKKKCILLWDLLFGAVFALVCAVLWHYSLQLRNWALITGIVIFAAAFVAGIVQLIMHIKNQTVKSVVTFITVVLLLITGVIAAQIGVLDYKTEHIVVDETGNKYVLHSGYSIFDYDCWFYEYKNFIVCSNEICDSVSYKGYNPFEPLNEDDEIVIASNSNKTYRLS